MNNLITQTTFRPSVDAIQEVQVQTGTYPAQYGGYIGVQINMISKSGTNDYHGSVFEFLRNEKLDAKPFFLRQGANKAPFKQNQYGINFNGPLSIPKLYNGKNRTFFMFAWERQLLRSSVPGVDGVLTAKMRAGDFSEQSAVVVDPFNARAPFPGNIVPASRLASQAVKALQYMPSPNAAGVGQGNFLINQPNNTTFNQFIGRVDHSIGEKNRFFFRNTYGDNVIRNDNTNPYNGYNQPVADLNWAIGYTRVISASTINDFRIGRQRTNIDSLNFFTAGGLYPSDAGT